ncbi:hypothetical protein OAD34_07535 [Flavobacteriaceae bacterium]|nr:hypothetical protein [Flavobacteriaceae bacterium]
MKPAISFLKFFTWLVVLASLFISKKGVSQNNTTSKNLDTIPFIRYGQVSTKFSKPTEELKKGQIISNVLKIINHADIPLNFSVDAIFPGGWKRIDSKNQIHTAKPKDTVFIPIIILPTKLVNGNTEIIVNTFIIDEDGQQIGNNFFTLTTTKKVAWSIDIKNNTNLYFKNDENTKDFNFSINNNGNYNQDIFVSYTIPRKDLILTDTLLKPLIEPNKTFTLLPGEKKEIKHKAIASSLNKRNENRISINNFLPLTNTQRIARTLIVNTSEPKIRKTDLQRKTKINFIKLPNEIEANSFGYPNLPLIVDLTAQNILDNRSFLSLNLQGFKQLNPEASLVYFTQLNYSNSFFSNNVFKNAPWYVGYFDDKKSIEIGQVNGDLIGASSSGKGIKLGYQFNEKHSAGGFYVNSNGFFSSENSIISYGGWYKFKYNESIRLRASAGRSSNNFTERVNNSIILQPSVNFLNSHSISFISGFNNLQFKVNDISQSTNGYLIGTNYSSITFKKKLRSNINVRYNDKYFSNGSSERINISQRFNYQLSKDWIAIATNNFQKSNIFNRNTDTFLYTQENFFSNVSFSKKTLKGSYQPGVFFEYRNFPNNSFVLRGLNFRYSLYNFEKNLLTSLFTRAGYAKPKNVIDSEEYFSLEMSGLFRYQTWSLTGRYNLGTFSSISSQQNQNNFSTPQSLRLSIQNQYLFPSRQFVLESNLIYSYNNIFKNHSLGIFPQLFYFSDSGWRFGLSANYMFTSSDFSSVYDTTNIGQNSNQLPVGPTVNSNLNLNFSLRKEFGVPIPFTNKTAASAKFVSFLDINGNNIKDKDEVSVQNIVVKLNKHEVITNFEGEASIKNVQQGKYKLEILPLEELNGWFSNTKDSIFINEDGINYIPFVRGIKVYGDIIIDRQKIAVTDDKKLDLSRIKISAIKGDKIYNTLTNKNGRFEFYLPFGSYTITMDEVILNDRFRVTRNNLPVKLRNDQDGVYVSFYIIEKRRKVIFKDFTKKKND